MKQGWRWFGPKDPITLSEIRQAGVTDIVTALHEVRCGELWTKEAIQERAKIVKQAGMTWSVVESVPVHESIKTRTGNFSEYIETYKQTLRNLAECGIKIICYNFMPILDWTRSQLDYRMPDGSTVLNCDATALAAFDIFMLKRQNAEKSYSKEDVAKAKNYFETSSAEQLKKTSDSILLGLPGTVDDLTLEEFRNLLDTYAQIDAETLRNNLHLFLNEIRPLCDELDLRMAIHPDDPPRPIFGLPRIMSTEDDIQKMCDAVPSFRIGLTLCSGSLGGKSDNNIIKIFKKFASRIHFAHFRNVAYEDGETFHESSHLTGHVDMAGLMTALIDEEKNRGESIVVRPDHGKLMDIDKNRNCYSGYSYGGRLMGLCELRGLEMGLKYGRRPQEGKVIVVTGGAGVLCSVITENLLQNGAKVAILGLHEDVAKDFAKKMANKGYTETLALGANVLEKESLIAAREKIMAKWGHIDILINGAGGNHPNGTCAAEQMTKDTPLENSFFGLSLEGFESVNKLNFIGTLLPSQVFGEVMLESGGSILNISSMSATQPLTKVAAYSAAKASIENFTRWLATHLAPMGIRVNAISPGFFITNQNKFLMLEADEKTLTARGLKVINKTPMRRFGQPADLCGAVRYLISDEASFVTGIVIPIDGGFLAYSGV